MKKNTIKAFTLVEMLIVIVIIGILIASLMPRMQAAQGRARDVARKNDLAQIQTAIIASQTDRGRWPQLSDTGARNGMAISGEITNDLINAGMSSIPSDPNASNKFDGLGNLTKTISVGKYGYMVSTRNGIADGGFVLMAKTETEGGSNWVVCSGATSAQGLGSGFIKTGQDLKDVQTCRSLTYNKDGNDCKNESGSCTYNQTEELRYILLY